MWLVAHAHFPVNQDQKSTNTTSLPSTSGNPANNSNCRGALCFSCFRSCYTSPQLYWFLLYLQKVNTNENRKKETWTLLGFGGGSRRSKTEFAIVSKRSWESSRKLPRNRLSCIIDHISEGFIEILIRSRWRSVIEVVAEARKRSKIRYKVAPAGTRSSGVNNSPDSKAINRIPRKTALASPMPLSLSLQHVWRRRPFKFTLYLTQPLQYLKSSVR